MSSEDPIESEEGNSKDLERELGIICSKFIRGKLSENNSMYARSLRADAEEEKNKEPNPEPEPDNS